MKKKNVLYYLTCFLMFMMYVSCSGDDVNESFVPEGYIKGPEKTLSAVVEMIEVKQNSKSTWRWMLHIQDLNNAYFAISMPANSIEEMEKPMIDDLEFKQGDIVNVRIDYFRYVMVTQDKIPPLPNAEGKFHICQ